MNSRFSSRIMQLLDVSRSEAERLRSRHVEPEHLLLGLIKVKDSSANSILASLNVDIMAMAQQLEDRVRDDAPEGGGATEIINDQATNILRLAVLEARMQHTQHVDEQHLLLAILHDSVNNGARQVLNFNNVTYQDVIALLQPDNGVQGGIDLPDDAVDDDEEPAFSEPSQSAQSGAQGAQTATARKPGSKTPLLDNFSTNLTQAALDGKLDPVVGREREISRIMEILGRRKKNNPILIGEAGVGKSAIVEGLAQMIAARRTSPMLFGKRVVSLDMTGIVAGTKYRGQFEERLRNIVKELEANPDIIVFIDEIHTMVGAGSTAGTMDAANILKPALARGVIQCIGATTLAEYRNSIEKDGALERRFQKVLVEPTTEEETLQILHNIKDRYERHHHVTYNDEALKACVRLTARYVTDRQFPDKAIDALDEVGSHIHLNLVQVSPEITEKEKEIAFVTEKKNMAVKHQNFELAASYRDRQTELEAELKKLNEQWESGELTERPTVGEQEVAEVVSMMSGVPVQRVAQGESVRLRGMGDALKGSVIAQDKAIETLVRAITRNRVGLKDPNHPIGAFMFLGPTGVGKTYLTKRLAEFMFGSADALIRIDMSEFSESFNVSRLVGAPPGYVGYEEGGQLTEKVRRHPYSIVLLDEIEKAHGTVFNMLLQVLDEGRLTDGNGRLVDFRNTVIIMTSNAGTRQLKDFGRGVGFNAAGVGLAQGEKDKEYARSIIQKSLSRQFSPEFLNRLDEIITFDQLDLQAIEKIVDLELNALSRRVESLGYHIEVSPEARSFVATKGYDVQFGARPLKRAIQTYIEDGLGERIVSGELKEGDTIRISKQAEKEELCFE